MNKKQFSHRLLMSNNRNQFDGEGLGRWFKYILLVKYSPLILMEINKIQIVQLASRLANNLAYLDLMKRLTDNQSYRKPPVYASLAQLKVTIHTYFKYIYYRVYIRVGIIPHKMFVNALQSAWN